MDYCLINDSQMIHSIYFIRSLYSKLLCDLNDNPVEYACYYLFNCYVMILIYDV